MVGYAATAPLNLAGPWGTLAWVVVGTGATILTAAGLLKLSEEVEKSRETERAVPRAIPKTDTEQCKRYTARVHAQGMDCGGTTASTIGVPAITQCVPVLVAQGLAMSMGTKALLAKRQLKTRMTAIAKAEAYIESGPASGGRFGMKSFVVLGVAGGIRYDVDCFGDGPSFVA